MGINSRVHWAGFVAVLLLCACSSTGSKVRVDKAADADLSRYQSFGWLTPANKRPSTLTEQRMQAAISEALRAKGYAEDTEHPDMQLTYTLSAYERPKSSGMRIGIGAAGGSGNVGGGVGVSMPVGSRSETAGTMSVDVFDASRKIQVWTGALDATFSSPEVPPDEAQRVINEILKQFPDRAQK